MGFSPYRLTIVAESLPQGAGTYSFSNSAIISFRSRPTSSRFINPQNSRLARWDTTSSCNPHLDAFQDTEAPPTHGCIAITLVSAEPI